MSDKQPLPSKRNPPNKTLAYLIMALFVVIVLASGIVYLVYLWPSHEYDAKWYNFSFSPASDVTMVIVINTTGPQQVTILNSSSEMAGISMHCVPGPGYYMLKEPDNKTIIEFRLNHTSGHDSAKVDTFVYLPRGYDYRMVLSGKNLYYDPEKIINDYGHGHLYIWIDDGEQHVRRLNYL